MEKAVRAYRRIAHTKEQQQAEQELLRRLQEEAKSKGVDYEHYKEQHAQEFENLYYQQDLKALCDMLDMGYSIRETTEAYTDGNRFAAQIGNDDFVKIFEDKVLGGLNDERARRASEEYDRAVLAYQSYQGEIRFQQDVHDEHLSVYREGKIVTRMMVRDGFSEKTIADVLEKESGRTPAYIKSLLESCGHVKQAYHAIWQAGSIDDAKSEYDLYRSVAKVYIKESGAELLTYDDDAAIVAEIRAMDFPEDLLKNAVSKASPVALAPGQDATGYTFSLLAGDTEPIVADRPVADADACYMDYIETWQKELKDKGILRGIDETNRPYYDTLAVRSLLLSHVAEADIANTLRGKSPQAIATRKDYIPWIISKAKRLIHAEQDLLHGAHPKLERGKSYSQLAAAGIGVAAILAGLLHEQLALTPAAALQLFAPRMDQILAETALFRYPDISREALQGAIARLPRAILLDGTNLPESKAYAENILREAEARLNALRAQEEAEKAVRKAYQEAEKAAKRRGDPTEKEKHPESLPRTALRMLIAGYTDMEVRQTILADAPDKADPIMENAHRAHARILQLKEYKPLEETRIQTAEEEYRNALCHEYQRRKFLTNRMDIQIARDMLAHGRHSTAKICAAILAFSPLAVEMGNAEAYARDYVLPNAKKDLLSQKEKLKSYHPVPRQNHEADAGAEYRFHQAQMKEAIHLPYSNQMDAKIAETMLAQGFPPVEIASAMQEESPCRGERKDYGLSVVNHARHEERRAKKEARSETPRIRIYEETTETAEEIITRTETWKEDAG